MVKYYLDEEKGWGVNPEEIVQRIKNAKDLGINLRGMVVINPGNPTGNVLKRHDIEEIIKICHDNEIVIIADEVYQSNIYKEDIPFISFRKVLAEMGDPYKDNVELISLHSVSKGLQGECGLRGGRSRTLRHCWWMARSLTCACTSSCALSTRSKCISTRRASRDSAPRTTRRRVTTTFRRHTPT